MTLPRGLTAYRTPLRGDVARVREGMQGQEYVTLLDGSADGNAPGSPACQVGIRMRLGRVSTPHVHDAVHVYVHLLEAGPQGVLTLWGEHLEQETWLFVGETLWIRPLVPHVAIYPRYDDRRLDADDVDVVDAPTALALETRLTPDPTYDVHPLPNLWSTLRLRLEERDLLDHVDLTTTQRAAIEGR